MFQKCSNLFPNNGKIPDGTDFNSLLTVGKYFVVSDDKTLTMTNVPEKVSGRLFVLNMLGDEKVLNKELPIFHSDLSTLHWYSLDANLEKRK